MKVGITILLLLTVVALMIEAKKSSKSKSEASRTSPKDSYATKKDSKKYSKPKKPSTKEVPLSSKSYKSTKASREEPEVSQSRYQSKRQPKIQRTQVYEEEIVAAPYGEHYPCAAGSCQQTYKKQRKVHRQQYDCNVYRTSQGEETLPAVRGPRSPCPFHEDVIASECPYADGSRKVECRSYVQQPSPVLSPPCSQQAPSCPPASPAPCHQPQHETPACPCAAATGSQPPLPAQVPPQAYPTININTYSGSPVANDAKIVNESESSADAVDGDTVKEEMVEEDEEQETAEGEEEDEASEDEEAEEPKTGKYSSCIDPELSEEMDDGYCYRSEL